MKTNKNKTKRKTGSWHQEDQQKHKQLQHQLRREFIRNKTFFNSTASGQKNDNLNTLGVFLEDWRLGG